MIEYAVIVAVIIGLTELVKQVLPSKYMPLISLVLGIVAGLVYVDAEIEMQVFIGIAMGLAASGLFDIATIPKKKIEQ